MLTFQRLIDWHTGNIFDTSNHAYASIQGVRAGHMAVRKDMEAHVLPESTWLSMYDMACVQAGFMGLAIIEARKFGLRGTGPINGVSSSPIFRTEC